MCKIKYKKLEVLISEARKNERISDNYATPFINLLKIKLTWEEFKQLNLGLEYIFVSKTKNIKKLLAVNFESIAERIRDNLQSYQREKFCKFLQVYVDIFTKSVYKTTDYTYKHVKRVINDNGFLVVSGDMESCGLFRMREIIRISHRKWLTMGLKMVFIKY